MCEVLVRVVDKTNADPYKDAKLTKRGDVIAVVEDGWAWGREELRNPEWRILKLPNVTLAAAENFLAPEVNDDPANPSRMLQRRSIRLNLAALPAGAAAWVADDARAEPTRTVSLSRTQFAALKIIKPKRSDPNVL